MARAVDVGQAEPETAVVEPARRKETRPSRPGQSQLRRNERRVAYIFLAPWFIGLFVITVFPILASLYLSFTDYSLLEAPEWIGMENYNRMFSDPRFLNAVAVTTKYVFISVPLQLAFALFLAIVLDRGVRGLAFYRSAYYLPSLLGSSVAIAVLWRQIFGARGLVNMVLGNFGVPAESWVTHPDTALWTLMVLNVWTFGSPMIIFLAGLRQIPTMYYEAARVDGAGPWHRFFRITIPLLTPVIFFNLVLQMIYAFQTFTQAFIVSSGTGAPADSTLFYTLYLYLRGFGAFDMGYASAMAWLLLMIVAGFTAVQFWLSKYWVFYGDE